MKRYCIPAVAVAAVVTTPLVARAVTIDFSFMGGGGGTVSGYLTFANANGQQDPTNVYITSAPGISPYDILANKSFALGAFTLSNSVVKAAFYFLETRSAFLDLNKNYNYDGFATLRSGFSTGNGNGFAGLTFTPADVPEPATIALLGAGLVGVGAFRRRRARA